MFSSSSRKQKQLREDFDKLYKSYSQPYINIIYPSKASSYRQFLHSFKSQTNQEKSTRVTPKTLLSQSNYQSITNEKIITRQQLTLSPDMHVVISLVTNN